MTTSVVLAALLLARRKLPAGFGSQSLGRGAVARRPRVALWGVILLCACRPAAPRGPECLELAAVTGTPVARVGDRVITAERLEQRLRVQGQGRQQFETARGLRELVEDEVRFELLARAATDRGLVRDQDVIDAARRVMVRKLLQRDLDPAVFEDALGDQALRAYYARHRDNYLQPEKRRFAHIQLAATEEGRATAQSLIDKLQLRSGQDFAATAGRLSLDADSRARGGEQGFATRDDVVDAFGLAFAQAVFAQAPGSVSAAPVPSTRGWHVVRILARRDALARDYGEVREQIRERLLQSQRSQEFEDYVERLRGTYPVAIYDDRLAALRDSWTRRGP